jgi:DNA polymerase sigma
MVVHLLQLRGVLPCLQDLQKYVPDLTSLSDLDTLNKYWKVGQNKESLGELVMAFFKYFSADFPYVHGAISIRTGGSISKDLKGWTREKQRLRVDVDSARDRFWFCGKLLFYLDKLIG